MNKKTIFYLLLLSCLFINACSPPKPDFDINNVVPLPSISEPADYKDSTLVKQVFPNDDIFLEDISEAKGKIKKRYWDTNDDDEWDDEFQDMDFIEVSFEEEGFHKIVFCANSTDNCVTKWVYVLSDGHGPDFDQKPKFIISAREIETEERHYDLEVRTENIFLKEEVNVKRDGKNIDFEFEQETILVPHIYIRRQGKAKVDIEAITTDGEASVSLTIISLRPVDSRKKKEEDDKKSPSVVILNKNQKVKTNNTKTDNEPVRQVSIRFEDYRPGQTVNLSRTTVEVKVTTENISKKNLLFKLGSKRLSEHNYKRVRHYGELKANSDWIVTLDLERNNSNLFSVEGKGVIQRINFIQKDVTPASGTIGLKAPPTPPSCLKNVEQNSFTVTLKTGNSPVALEGFSLYTSSCGRVKVTLSGPGYSNTFYASVIDVGKSQIIFEDYPELKVNSTYQLTLEAGTGGGCSSSVPPLFKSAENCNISSQSSSALSLNQPDGKFIYDLKF